jgi:nucleoside-diphosphate-sugar epimerase
MRVFVTGASGFIGSALTADLIAAGHQVLGLARSDAAAATITGAGATAVPGDIDDLDVLCANAKSADAVAHLAFNHDFLDFAAAARSESNAISAIGGVLEGTGKPLVFASGLIGLPSGRLVTERDTSSSVSYGNPRAVTARFAMSLASRGVRVCAVRLAPTVHDQTKKGFVGSLVDTARATGVSGYLGDGSNHWPSLHRLDAASLFHLALEKAPAGSILHGAGDEGIQLRSIAEIIGRHLDVPVASIPDAAAAEHFGWLANVLGLDVRASSTITQELLGWKPTHPGLIDDLENGHFFDPTPTL